MDLFLPEVFWPPEKKAFDPGKPSVSFDGFLAAGGRNRTDTEKAKLNSGTEVKRIHLPLRERIR
jgi:hypothetical protein